MNDDIRCDYCGHTDYVYAMPRFTSLQEWQTRVETLRRRILVGAGLVPMPEGTPLNAKIFGRIDHTDYTIENVRFEVRPGFYCTGNLYRPPGLGPFPGVLCPHGHWPHGRLTDIPRGSIPARCITLARMGAVVFSYDMIGYCDSVQFPHNWGGKHERIWGIHSFGFQLWTSVRALDFLVSLNGIDSGRIAITGASGGATQTIALYAIDDRVTVAAPVNMISRRMQGGCLCENGPLLRLDNSNVELAAMMAPRPLLIVSTAGDWTAETPNLEYPAIREIYRLFGAADRVENRHFSHEHNYNLESRTAVYRFFGKWLFGDEKRFRNFVEPDYDVDREADLRVPLPPTAPSNHEVIQATIDSNRAKWNVTYPTSPTGAATFQANGRLALSTVFDATLPAPAQIEAERQIRQVRQNYSLERWTLHGRARADVIPVVLFAPNETEPLDAVLLVHGSDRTAIIDPEKGPGLLVSRCISAGMIVMTVDISMTREHTAQHEDLMIDRPDEDLYMNGGRFYIDDTFRPTSAARRVQEILTAATWLRKRLNTQSINLAGIHEGGLPSLFASALDSSINRTFVDANVFAREDDAEWVDRFYVPGLRSIGDVVTACLLVSPRPLGIANTGEVFETGDICRHMQIAGFANPTVCETMPDEEWIVHFFLSRGTRDAS